ncbi:unnamed protein product [Arabis nemorensis]|uniref:Uncharacterized protein n=1 Tax=Arabis nemorensis TaxID=586526 RepID=A0A565AUZ1_9BRAS|nr:unnamed protein product [Arabis nemorensis]
MIRLSLCYCTVSRTKFRSGYRRVEGYYQFYLEDIKDLRVIRVPVPKSTTNTNKDDQKTNPAGASSSASTSK